MTPTTELTRIEELRGVCAGLRQCLTAVRTQQPLLADVFVQGLMQS